MLVALYRIASPYVTWISGWKFLSPFDNDQLLIKDKTRLDFVLTVNHTEAICSHLSHRDRTITAFCCPLLCYYKIKFILYNQPSTSHHHCPVNVCKRHWVGDQLQFVYYIWNIFAQTNKSTTHIPPAAYDRPLCLHLVFVADQWLCNETWLDMWL